MNEGWKCPGCDACYAPFVPKCDTCGTINPPIRMPQCAHIWGAQTTAGVFCTLCGVAKMLPVPTGTTCGTALGTTYQDYVCVHEWMLTSHGEQCADCGKRRDNGNN